MEASISAATLSSHDKEDDVWLCIHGQVYNVTTYLQDHPGGMDVMMEHAGKDATEEFEYYGHSDKARQQLKEFLVGTFEGGDVAPLAQQAKSAPKAAASQATKIVLALLPVALLLFAFVVKQYLGTASTSA